MSVYQRMRLKEINPFDIERILKENMENIHLRNTQLVSEAQAAIEAGGVEEEIAFMLRDLDDNSAEILRLASLTYHAEDSNYITNSPLFRREVTK